MSEVVKVIKRNLTKQDNKLVRVAAYCRVSTDSEDQANSFDNQVNYYKQHILQNKEWIFVGIYADEGISGVSVNKRSQFQSMIGDCFDKKIDLIITKSISRFARNTIDTLHYVRQLKEIGIPVIFEEENINTMTMDGELLLTILSSVAQQEVYNVSNNVKRGIKMKMERGEVVGYGRCYGYNYDSKRKEFSIIEEEAEVVRFIFDRYLSGYGCKKIAQELTSLSIKTPRGETKWHDNTVLAILKNEKYKGDLYQGKHVINDPLAKKKSKFVDDVNELYIVENHHVPIVSRDTWDKCQTILKDRKSSIFIEREGNQLFGKYALSSVCQCGFCSSQLRRRTHGFNVKKNVAAWKCASTIIKNKNTCPNSLAIHEDAIKKAFVEGFNLVCSSDDNTIKKFISLIENALGNQYGANKLEAAKKELSSLEFKKNRYINLRVEDKISDEDYIIKYESIKKLIEDKKLEIAKFIEIEEKQKDAYNRLETFKELLMNNNKLEEFDDTLFKTIVRKVVIGGSVDNSIDPLLITFVYKFDNSSDITGTVVASKNVDYLTNTVPLCDYQIEYKHYIFPVDKNGSKHKVVENFINAKIVMQIG